MTPFDRHAYIGPGIDGAVVHEQAMTRCTDKREPTSTVVHDHAALKPCKEHKHSLYTIHYPVEHNVEVDSGTIEWGIQDPITPDGRLTMTKNLGRK